MSYTATTISEHIWNEGVIEGEIKGEIKGQIKILESLYLSTVLSKEQFVLVKNSVKAKTFLRILYTRPCEPEIPLFLPFQFLSFCQIDGNPSICILYCVYKMLYAQYHCCNLPASVAPQHEIFSCPPQEQYNHPYLTMEKQ